MKFLAILHVPYEGPGLISEWMSLRNHTMEVALASEIPSEADTDSYDGIIVMGGPMSVHDDDRYPWLIKEKQTITEAIDKGRKILGICLGSQLLAHCLGARVYKNTDTEIGWFPVKKKFFMHSWFPVFDENEKVNVFHWHGDTYDLPEGCVHLFDSEGCKHQAFAFEDQVLGLQFHPEINEELITLFIEHGKSDMKPGRFIQSESRMLSNCKLYEENTRSILFDLLDDFFTE